MKRLGLAAVAVLALAACDPQVPDSGAGVGFGNYTSYSSEQQAQERSARNAQLTASVPTGTPEQTGAPTATAASAPPAVSTADLAAAGIGPSSRATSGESATVFSGVISAPETTTSEPIGAPLSAISVAPAAAPANPTGISDEQDFSAVSSRQSIQSDADRLAQQRTQYQTVTPTSVPQRPVNTGPDIVAYAVGTSHSVGQQMHRRTLASQSRAARKCARFGSDDRAQLAFLEAGGPQKDRLGIDPDGDGYACNWDPTVYRRAVGG